MILVCSSIRITPSHQFRHSAVTDRAYTVGYTTEQIRRLTGHKNEVMPKHYTHQLIEKHKKIHLDIEGLGSPNDSPVEFRGKIMNLDERTTKLSRDSRRYLTWEANGKKEWVFVVISPAVIDINITPCLLNG